MNKLQHICNQITEKIESGHISPGFRGIRVPISISIVETEIIKNISEQICREIDNEILGILGGI